MTGFDAAWLEKHRARMASLGSHTPVPDAPAVEEKKHRHRSGVRADIGPMSFRSQWEANYARYLNLRIKLGEIRSWDYETKEFWFDGIKRGVRSYKPDFEVWPVDSESSFFIELKGWMDPKSKTKIKRMRIYYPSVRLVVVGQDEYRGLVRTARPLIPNWE